MLTKAQVDAVKALLNEGLNCRQVAEQVGVGRTTVQRINDGLPNKKPPREQPYKRYQPVPRTEAEYARIRRDAIAAMEAKLAKKREALT